MVGGSGLGSITIRLIPKVRLDLAMRVLLPDGEHKIRAVPISMKNKRSNISTRAKPGTSCPL